MPTVEAIARVAYEAIAAYCITINDPAPLPWDSIPQPEQANVIAGVRQRLGNPDRTPAQIHGAWMQHRLSTGWVYGPEKSYHRKTHPCLLPYSDLPPEQTLKDALFLAIVDTLAGRGPAS